MCSKIFNVGALHYSISQSPHHGQIYSYLVKEYQKKILWPVSWYLYKMVAQNKLRTYEVK